MEKKRAVDLLIQEVDKIPYLKTLPSSNAEFRLWLKNVENIINKGLESEDKNKYQEASQFLRYLRGAHEEDLIQQDYIDEIVRYEIALKSIIQRYEILEFEEKPAENVAPAEVLKEYEEKASIEELELTVRGTTDMIIETIMNFVRKLRLKNYLYKCVPRISDTPDYAKWDRTYSAYCDVFTIRSDGDVKIGILRLQLLPDEQTLINFQKPEQWDSSFGLFLTHLVGEFERLRLLEFDKEKPPLGFKLPHQDNI